MTFGARTFQGQATLPGVITSPSINVTNTSASTGIRSGSFTLVTDGTITYVSGSGSSSWFTPTTAGIGSSIWVFMTVTSSANTTVGGTTGAWISLSSNRTWNFQNTATNNLGTGTFTLSFATDSIGGNVVGSGTGGWSVGFSP